MKGERELQRLLADGAPRLLPADYVFVTLADAAYGDGAALAPVAACREAEGWTLVVPRARAEAHGLPHAGVFRCISLDVCSSLHAIGLTAAVAARLAAHGIAANVVAGYHHDHVFVPAERAEEAVARLRGDLTR